MLMMMPPYHGALLKADEDGMIEHFAQVAEAARIPIMIQDAPLERRDPQRAVPGAACAGGAAGTLLQDRGAGHGRQVARA